MSTRTTTIGLTAEFASFLPSFLPSFLASLRMYEANNHALTGKKRT